MDAPIQQAGRHGLLKVEGVRHKLPGVYMLGQHLEGRVWKGLLDQGQDQVTEHLYIIDWVFVCIKVSGKWQMACVPRGAGCRYMLVQVMLSNLNAGTKVNASICTMKRHTVFVPGETW